MSWNRISEEDSKRIAKILEPNHTIYGFHFEGNYGALNEL